MMNYNFIESPDLPTKRVCHVVVSPIYSQVISALEEFYIIPLTVTSCNNVLVGLDFHADMLFRHLGGNRFVTEGSQIDLIKKLNDLGAVNTAENIILGKDYPSDIALNFFILKNSLFGYSDNIPLSLKNKFFINHVKQGYAKCSTIIVDDNSVITDDKSIYTSVINAGFDALLIKRHFIILEGFDTGFIGGCCGKISPDIVAFCGDISKHPSFPQIESFMKERGVYPYSLFGGDLIDIGSIIPLTEYK